MEYVYADEAIDMGATLDNGFWENVSLLYGDVELSDYVDWDLSEFATTEELLAQTITD